jgi:hypothetical protein
VYIGRECSRIYLMWNPEAQKEVRTSSVTFASAHLLDASVERATALPVPTFSAPVIPTSPVTLARAPSPLHPTAEDVSEDDNGPAAPLVSSWEQETKCDVRCIVKCCVVD